MQVSTYVFPLYNITKLLIFEMPLTKSHVFALYFYSSKNIEAGRPKFAELHNHEAATVQTELFLIFSFLSFSCQTKLYASYN
jgi:hypothetical protein